MKTPCAECGHMCLGPVCRRCERTLFITAALQTLRHERDYLDDSGEDPDE